MSLVLMTPPTEENPLAGAIVYDPWRSIVGQNILPAGTADATRFSGTYRVTVSGESVLETVDNSLHSIYLDPSGLGAATACPLFVAADIKANGRTRVGIAIGASEAKWAIFDLSAGTVIATQASITGAISDAGNGYYRCSAYTAARDSGNVGILTLLDGATDMSGKSFAGDITKGFLLKKGQISIGRTEYSTPAGYPQSLSAYNGSTWGRLPQYDAQNGSTATTDANDASWGANCLTFPDGTDYVPLPATPNVGDFTVMVVAKVKAGVTFNYQNLYTRNNIRLLLDNANGIYVSGRNTDSTQVETPAQTILKDTWYLFTAKLKGSSVAVDSLPIGSISNFNTDGKALDSTYTAYGHKLGGGSSGNWQGDIAFSAEWGKCLSDGDVIKAKAYIRRLMTARGITL